MEAKAIQELDSRLRKVEIDTSKLPDRVDSHSRRIRELEFFKVKVLAYATIGSVIGGTITAIVVAIIERK
jgi:hypothetical protein